VPIHDQGYRRYGGEKAPHGRAWAVIASAGIRAMFRKRAFLGLLLLSWAPFFVRAVQIYAAANLPQAAFLAPTPEMFSDFLMQQNTFVFFVAVYVGSGLIASDRRANALQIYLAKPLSRAEYIFGKLAVLLAFLLLVTWVPAIMLLLVQVMFAGNVTFFVDHIHLFPAITLSAFLQALTVSAAMLALSSLSKSSRYVGILYAGVIFFTQAMYRVLYEVTRDSSWAWVSFIANMWQVNAVIFRMRPLYATPWPVSLAVLLGVIAVSAWILEKRVRGVEVVA
jgi:ABC-type transport system involved in multi-copper enzyme maturation permease subunit